MAELDPTTFRPETRALHSGQKPDPATNARAVPIYATTSYVFDDAAHAARLFGLQEFGNIYTRIMNPTTDVFEQRVAALEGGVAALGARLRPGGRDAVDPQPRPRRRQHRVVVVACTAARTTCSPTPCPRSASRRRYVDGSDPSAFGRAINERTKAVFLELIGNPRLDVHDLASIADVAHARGVPVIVDNTFAPLIAQPIKHGADIVIHSATKWIGGHGTAIGGVVVDGGTFDWAASERFKADFVDPDPSLPRDQLHGRVRQPRVHPQAARPGPARHRRRAQPVQRVPLPAGPRDAAAADHAPQRERAGGREVARDPARGHLGQLPGSRVAPVAQAGQAVPHRRLRRRS